jgi:hypothetical protein
VGITCICHTRIDPTQSLAKECVLLPLEEFKILITQSLPKVKRREEIPRPKFIDPIQSAGKEQTEPRGVDK